MASPEKEPVNPNMQEFEADLSKRLGLPEEEDEDDEDS